MTKIHDADGKPVKCSAKVYGGGYYAISCHNSATVLRGDTNKPFCGIHDPVRKAEKRAERNRQWKESWDAKETARKERRAVYAQEIVSCHDYDQALTLFDRIRRGAY
jgi:hypothetical protein